MTGLFSTSPPDGSDHPDSKAGRFVTVALEQGIDRELTYKLPDAIGQVEVGDRVMVPLGRGDKAVSAYVTGRMDHTDVRRIKPVIEKDANSVSLTADLIALARWMGDYYCCPVGMVFATMLPAAVKHGTGRTRRTLVSLAAEPAEVKLTALQKSVLEAARQAASEGEAWLEPRTLADRAGARSVTPVQHLLDKGIFVSRIEEDVTARADAMTLPPPGKHLPIRINPDQQRIVDSLTATLGDGFGVHLIRGVTGSGKTEVYLQAIEQLHHRDPDAGIIVLVPEIALTPQTAARFQGRFDRVAVMHSGLTAAQRHEQWRRIRTGKANVVVGARSAVFAPLTNLRMIVVDEEHESSYKQDQLPRYHARDVAVKRAQLCGATVVLGSATPSLESWFNATEPTDDADAAPRFRLHELPDRVAGFKLPPVQIVDMVEERRHRRGIHLLSEALEQALRRTLDEGGQALLLLNRRGFASYVACPDHGCGWTLTCPHCDTLAVYHLDRSLPTGGVVRCHHCNAEQILPKVCPQSGHRITTFGLGVQRVEQELAQKFPDLMDVNRRANPAWPAMYRMDSDTMRTGRDYFEVLEAFSRADIRLLVGTQVIAKGHDFPNVRLVGVVSGDTALHLPDFRASERTFQLIAQVAGRAGRGEHSGRVIVQTFNPDDPTIQLAAQHDFVGFAARELDIRRSSRVPLPPISRMARIVVRDKDHVKAHEQARTLADHLTRFDAELQLGIFQRGPAPCAIARIADFHRLQIELIAPPPRPAARLQQLMRALRRASLLKSDLHTAVDVDPTSLL